MIKCEDTHTCVDCIRANRPSAEGSPIPEICQWCRFTGKCFNASVPQPQLRGSEAAARAPKCNARCTVQSESMCPSNDLVCGAQLTCNLCTNHSFCSFCDATQTCFNPCGDDFRAPIASPTLVVPSSGPSPSFDNPNTSPYDPEDEPESPLELQNIDFFGENALWSNSELGASRRGLQHKTMRSKWETINEKLDEKDYQLTTSDLEVMENFQSETCPSCAWSAPGQCAVAATCRTLKTCSACTRNPGCGWCGSTESGKCIPAVEKKPCEAEGASTCKYWSYGSCEQACNSHSSCNACTSGGCGWCAGGVYKQRRTSYCSVLGGGNQCTAIFNERCPECSQVKNCTTCLKTHFCGYCANSNPTLSKCVEGDLMLGPFDPSDCASSNEPGVGWIRACQTWNETVPISPPHTAPLPNPAPAPIAPPVNVPHHEPQTQPSAPVQPPTTPVAPPTAPIAPPLNPPSSPEPTTPSQTPITSPQTTPADAPSYLEPSKPQPPTLQPLPPNDMPSSEPDFISPEKQIQPYLKRIQKRYQIGLIVGGSLAAGIVLLGGILWVNLHMRATHRYRTIGT